MLVLERKSEEAIIIKVGDRKIRIVVAAISPKKVKLAIDAPKQFLVLREELDTR